MSKYKRAFDTWELEIYGNTEESFRPNGTACWAKLLLRRCKNYYDSWERFMQREIEWYIVLKKLKII